jgi:endonuclease III
VASRAPVSPALLAKQLDRLEGLYGAPEKLPPRGALEWILWENAAYLVPAEKRAACFRALKKRAGSSGAGILRARREELLELAHEGGMLPEQRVEKWLEIATTVQEEFDGDLEAVLERPLAKARTALKKFPGIGEPGAEKILLFTGKHALFALESNGLRVLVRLGYAREEKNYSTTYRALRTALAPLESRGAAWLQRAHLLLQRHGQELCKRTAPRCDDCPLLAGCPSAE